MSCLPCERCDRIVDLDYTGLFIGNACYCERCADDIWKEVDDADAYAEEMEQRAKEEEVKRLASYCKAEDYEQRYPQQDVGMGAYPSQNLFCATCGRLLTPDNATGPACDCCEVSDA